MGRRASITYPLSDGRVIGASLKLRGSYYRIQFPHPVQPGRYVEISTGCDTIADAQSEGARIILKHYVPTHPADPKKVTWDAVVAELEKLTSRTVTRGHYVQAVTTLRQFVPQSKGPADITPAVAQQFARTYATTRYTRSKASDARTYARSAQTVFTTLANLSIVWSHLKDFQFVTTDPWENVKRPRLPKRKPTIPTEDAVSTLFTWLSTRFPGWELVRLFVEVKSISGCRLIDLSYVRSDQLRGDTLTITPDQDKTHRERTIPLPADIAARLHAIKGTTYLWERYTTDAMTYRKGRRTESTFRPSLMYNGMKWVFKQYAVDHPEAKIRSHDLRKRAITLTTMATGNIDATAQAIGIDPQTARRYYLDAKTAFDSDELMRRMAGVLRPTTAPEK